MATHLQRILNIGKERVVREECELVVAVVVVAGLFNFQVVHVDVVLNEQKIMRNFQSNAN